jgi:hypothetical protein
MWWATDAMPRDAIASTSYSVAPWSAASDPSSG